MTPTEINFHGRWGEELKRVFESLQQDGRTRAVILTGTDKIFCMGGTKELLLNISQRKFNYSDEPFTYKGLLEFPLPVIASMKGHAMGAGLAFGFQADMVILSEESLYSANFMKYGFTPGVGSTLFLREKFGVNIANELMFTADVFTGKALRNKGAPLTIVKSEDVFSEALKQARSLAEKPLNALMLLKESIAARLLEKLPQVVASELAMHEKTITRPEVMRQIEEKIDRMESLSPREQESLSSPKEEKPVMAMGVSVKNGLEMELIKITAHYLHLEESEVSKEMTFREMGVDSICAVEIIQAVNERLSLNLESSIVYDYPTIKKLASHIVEKRPPERTLPQKNEHSRALLNLKDENASLPARGKPIRQKEAVKSLAMRADSRDGLEMELMKITAHYLHLEESEVSKEMTFREMGADSICAVEIIQAVNERLSLNLESSIVYDYPTVKKLVSHIIEKSPSETTLPQKFGFSRPSLKLKNKNVLFAPATKRKNGRVVLSVSAQSETLERRRQNSVKLPHDDVAVIGVSGRFPAAENVDALWANLVQGKSSITEIPEERWHSNGNAADAEKKGNRWGGFLDGIEAFDPLFFHISPAEAEAMDPQYRLLLEESWRAFEDAGYAPEQLSDTSCGVFVGMTSGDYAEQVSPSQGTNLYSLPSMGCSVAAGKIAYHFDLKGRIWRSIPVVPLLWWRFIMPVTV